MTKLYLTYDEYRTGGEICEGQENDSWPNYEDEYNHFTPERVFLDQANVPSWQKETFEVEDGVEKGDTVHLVIVRYGDGSTFGHTSGYWKIMGATRYLDLARKLMQSIPNGDWKISPIRSEHAYEVWSGYFSSFDGVDVHTFVVE